MEEANPYTTIIVDEAKRRGIAVQMIDPSIGEMVLALGERRIRTIQSLSELTSAIAFVNCDDKARTRAMLDEAGLPVPEGRLASFDEGDLAFVRSHDGGVVVKPVQGEGGAGISVGVGENRLAEALEEARSVSSRVLIEERFHGVDLRVLVIADEVVAAAQRRPPQVTGDGESTIEELAEALDAQRAEATGGAVGVELDAAALAYIGEQGFEPTDTPQQGTTVQLRGTANVHVGGTIDDVTDRISTELAEAAIAATRAVGAPLAGVDFLAEGVGEGSFVIIEVNEQPGLANHEPHPTAERFIDLLFPESTGAGT